MLKRNPDAVARPVPAPGLANPLTWVSQPHGRLRWGDISGEHRGFATITPCSSQGSSVIEAHLHRLRKRAAISASEEEALRSLVSESRRHGPDKVLVAEEELLKHSLLLLH